MTASSRPSRDIPTCGSTAWSRSTIASAPMTSAKHVIGDDKEIETRNGQPVYMTYPIEETASRWFKNLKRLSDENEELGELRTIVEELKGEKERLEKSAEDQNTEVNRLKAEARRQHKFGTERNTLLEVEREKKDKYKTRYNGVQKEKEMLKMELEEANEQLGKCEAQKAEEFASLEENIARLQKESNEKTTFLKQAEKVLKANEVELHAKIQELAEVTGRLQDSKEALDGMQKKVEVLEKNEEKLRKEHEDRSAEDQRRLQEYKEITEDLMKMVKTRDQELKRMKAEKEKDRSDRDLRALCQKIEKMEKTVEKREREHEVSLQAKVEQLEAALAKKDEQIADNLTTIRQLSECLHSAHKGQSSEGEETSIDVTASSPRNLTKRRIDPHEETISEGEGEETSQNQDNGGDSYPDATDYSDHSSRRSRSPNWDELHERILRLQKPRQRSVELVEELILKDEIVDEDECVEMHTASPEEEKVVERDPRKAKRARRG